MSLKTSVMAIFEAIMSKLPHGHMAITESNLAKLAVLGNFSKKVVKRASQFDHHTLNESKICLTEHFPLYNFATSFVYLKSGGTSRISIRKPQLFFLRTPETYTKPIRGREQTLSNVGKFYNTLMSTFC